MQEQNTLTPTKEREETSLAQEGFEFPPALGPISKDSELPTEHPGKC